MDFHTGSQFQGIVGGDEQMALRLVIERAGAGMARVWRGRRYGAGAGMAQAQVWRGNRKERNRRRRDKRGFFFFRGSRCIVG